MLLRIYNFPAMQLSRIQSALTWLLLPALAMAASLPLDGSTTVGNGQLNLITPSNLSATLPNRAVYCKSPDDPYPPFISSLNYTFPPTPSLSEILASLGVSHSAESYSFDCFLELPPGGLVTFEVC